MSDDGQIGFFFHISSFFHPVMIISVCHTATAINAMIWGEQYTNIIAIRSCSQAMTFFHLDAVIESFFSENPDKLHKDFIHTAVASVGMSFHRHLKTFRPQTFQTDDQFSYFHDTYGTSIVTTNYAPFLHHDSLQETSEYIGITIQLTDI